MRQLSTSLFLWVPVSLLLEGGNLTLICFSMGIVEWIVNGAADGLLTMLVILVLLVSLTTVSIAIVLRLATRHSTPITYDQLSDLMTEEEYERWQQKHKRKK